MFESVVQLVVSNLFGDYVGQLDVNGISFALLQGQLDLENVPLRSQSLSQFNLPFGQLKQGLVGHFSLHIPPSSLFSSSQQWTLELADVFIHVGLDNSLVELNANLEEKEQTALFEWTQIVQAVSSKIQIVVKNLHIRLDFASTISFDLRLRHLFAHLNDPNENGLLGEIQINGFQLRFLNESNLFDLDELKRAPWSFEDALLGVDKMGVFMEVEGESGELKLSVISKSIQTTTTTQHFSFLLNFLKQQPSTFDCIDFTRLFDLNLAFAYDVIKSGIGLLFGRDIEAIRVNTKVDRTEAKLLDEPSSVSFHFDLFDFTYSLKIYSDHIDFNFNFNNFKLQLIDQHMDVDEDLFYDVFEERQPKEQQTIFVLEKIELNNEMDTYYMEFNGRPFTMTRVYVMDLGFSKAKLQVNISYSMEFFNDKKNAWEPFMDRVEKVQLEFDLNRREFGLIVADQPLIFTYTQSIITQLIQFQQKLLKFNFSSLALLFAQIHSLLGFRFSLELSTVEFSLIDGKNKELLFGQVLGVQVNGNFLVGNRVQLSVRVGKVQIDNQLINSKQWQFLHCSAQHPLLAEPDQLKKHCIPAFQLEIAYNLDELENGLDFDCFRLKFSNIYLNADELLLFHLLKFFNNVWLHIDFNRIFANLNFPIYFDNLELTFDSIFVSIFAKPNPFAVETVGRNGLPEELHPFFDWVPLPLVSFQNAQIKLPTFRRLKHEFNGLDAVFWTLFEFYYYQILKQLLNIASALDAFGAPSTLSRSIEHGVGGLLFNGDFGGFLSDLSHGLTNSVAKLAASMSHGAGQLTFDVEHFQVRQDAIKYSILNDDPQSAFSLMYTGVKSLGIGLYGGLTAIAKNTVESTQADGFKGFLSGVSTGVVDTITKPTQGLFDLMEASALALKSMVGSEMQPILGFPFKRLRLSQFYQDEEEPLVRYDVKFVQQQHEFYGIVGRETREVLKAYLICYKIKLDNSTVVQDAFFTQNHCYIVRKVDNQLKEIVQRVMFGELVNCQVLTVRNSKKGAVELQFKDQSGNLVLCSTIDVAQKLCEMLQERVL